MTILEIIGIIILLILVYEVVKPLILPTLVLVIIWWAYTAGYFTPIMPQLKQLYNQVHSEIIKITSNN